jgi:hypothetical protein
MSPLDMPRPSAKPVKWEATVMVPIKITVSAQTAYYAIQKACEKWAQRGFIIVDPHSVQVKLK